MEYFGRFDMVETILASIIFSVFLICLFMSIFTKSKRHRLLSIMVLFFCLIAMFVIFTLKFPDVVKQLQETEWQVKQKNI